VLIVLLSVILNHQKQGALWAKTPPPNNHAGWNGITLAKEYFERKMCWSVINAEGIAIQL
jgi:hypothetical protein